MPLMLVSYSSYITPPQISETMWTVIRQKIEEKGGAICEPEIRGFEPHREARDCV